MVVGCHEFAVIAPVGAGVTADPEWMSAFVRHVESCGFESIVVVEHTVLATEYSRPLAGCPLLYLAFERRGRHLERCRTTLVRNLD